MSRCKNFIEINTLELMIEEIEKALDSNSLFSALHMALSIPDMLGKLAYSGQDIKNKYVKWFDNNVRDIIFGHLHSENPLGKDDGCPKMNGEVCYAIRNKLC